MPQIAWPPLPGTGVAAAARSVGKTVSLTTVPGPLSVPPIRSTVAGTSALFVGIALMMSGNGLQFSTIGVGSTLAEFSAVAIGLLSAACYLGFLLGAIFTFGALRRVGHIRVFAAFASSASASVLLHSLWTNPATWSVLRFVTGFCMAGLYMVAESWINDRAGNHNRGLFMSAYMVVGIGARAAGQALLNVGDPGGVDLFVVSSVLVSMALVPIAMSESSSPPVVTPQRLTLREMWSVAPNGVVTVFAAGLSTSMLGGLLAVYATRVGMSTRDVSIFVSAQLIGAVVLQIPIGTASDRFLRRPVMLLTTLGASGTAVALVVGPQKGVVAVGLIFLMGGFVHPMYSLGAAHTNDWIPGEQRAGAAMLIMLISGSGAVVGPIAASIAMAVAVEGLFWSVAAVHAVFALFLLVRIVSRPPVPVDQKSAFAPVPERATAVILSRARRRGAGPARRETGPGSDGTPDDR